MNTITDKRYQCPQCGRSHDPAVSACIGPSAAIGSSSSVFPAPVATTEEWRYEFRPDDKYPDLGIYTILAPNPDAGKEGVVYSGAEIALADTNDKEIAEQIISDHRLAALVPQLEKASTRTTERLKDLPRYLESNGMGTMASIVSDCLEELRVASAAAKGATE